MRLRTAVSGICILFALCVAISHSTGRLWPVVPAALVLSLLLITGLDDDQLPAAIALVCTVSVAYRLMIMMIPNSLIGMDPDRYAWAIHNVVETRSVAGSEFSVFYEQTGVMLSFGAISSVVPGLDATETMATYAIILGLIVPLSVAAISQRLWPSKPRIPIYSASIATVATAMLKFSGWPIAQSLAVVFWVVFLLLLFRLLEPDRRFATLVIGIAVPLAFVHKLSPLITLLAAVGVLLGSASARSRLYKAPQSNPVRTLGMVGLALTILAYLQWNTSGYFIGVVWHSLRTIDFSGGVSSSINITAAEPILDGLTLLIYRRGHALALGTFAGFGWLLLLVSDRRGSTRLLLGCVAVVEGFTALAFVAPRLSFERPVFFAEPLLAIVAGVILAAIATTKRVSASNHLASVLFIGLLLTQAFAAPAMPDSTHQPRYYLEGNEIESKQHASTYGPDTVHTDYYLAEERVNWTGDSDTEFEAADEAYLKGNLVGEYIVYRDPGVWYTPHLLPAAPGSMWELTWDPSKELDQKYNRVYDSESTSHYNSFV